MSDDYEHGDLAAFRQWADRRRPGDTHAKEVECGYHYTEYGVMEGRGRSNQNRDDYGWFSLIKSYRSLDHANEYANAKPNRFVVQRDVYCEVWQ